jgi:hypothetical protein
VQLLKEKLEVERKDMEDACDRIRLAFEQKCVLHLPPPCFPALKKGHIFTIQTCFAHFISPFIPMSLGTFPR